MSGISGFKSFDVPTLPRPDTDFGIKLPPDAKTYDLSISGAFPDTQDMAPEKLFEVIAEYIKDQGSPELKAAVENGEVFALRITDEFGNKYAFSVDAYRNLATAADNPRDPIEGTVSCAFNDDL